MNKFFLPCALLAALSCLPAVSRAQNADAIWLEGESPANANVKYEANAWGHTEFFSGGKWLEVNIDENKAEKDVPDGGVLLSYAFSVPKAADYEIWDRIGYEFARSRFEWRVDGAEWKAVSPEELTTDLMEFATWNELAWLKLGRPHLPAGAHTLTIRLPKTKKADGKYERVLYGSDALCITAEAFHPNSKFKPGTFRDEPIDGEAAKNVFTLPEPAANAARISVPLKGAWEICRDDEQTPGEVAEPLKNLPAAPIWTGIAVPGDKNALRPDLLFAHRVWYRTKIAVPASEAGRSFQITFPQNNLNTTVFVNGIYCGFNKNPFAKFTIDVTKGIKPGQTNEIYVGIRDAYYGYSANPNHPLKLRKTFNMPLEFTEHGFQDFAYPVWHGMQSGILDVPEFTASGGVYAADVFCKPSVAKKALDLEITLVNQGGNGTTGEMVCEAVNPATGAVEKAFPATNFSLNSGEVKILNVGGAWGNPRLWWPDDPQMTVLRTTIKAGGKIVDVSETPFGFREWGHVGKDYTLNGVTWHVWADLQPGNTPEEFLANYRKTYQKSMRYMGVSQGGVHWMGMQPTDALNFFDKNGVVVRRCGPLDGEAIGYNAIENDPDLQKIYHTDIKMDLLNNVRDQMVAQVRAERNHPSVMLWSLENEYLFINCINLYGDRMDKFEKAILDISNAVQAVDPTRLVMTDGGGANKDNAMPVHGNHYVYTNSPASYPDLAYELFPEGGGRGRWVWDVKRPRFIGEDYFATGINPADYAWIGGEAAFQGKAQAAPAMALVFKMLTEGYRWAEQSAWHHWVGPDSMSGSGVYNSQSWLAVFCRQWDWTFSGGQKVRRTFGIFNDTHDSSPVTFVWTLNLGGKKAASAFSEYTVPAGTNKKFDLTIPMPPVAARTEGELVLTLTQKGKQIFRDAKAISLLPAAKFSTIAHTGTTLAANRPGGALTAKSFLVYDPNGSVSAYLKAQSAAFTPVANLNALPEYGKVLIIGKDALTVPESTSSALAAYAAAGRTVIVLEQKNPLKYQALPAQIEPSDATGRIAFGEDLSHPALRGLRQKDFFTWSGGTSGDSILYRNAYVKPTAGAKSLIQCDSRLQNSALVEVPAGKGLLLLSQLTIGEKIGSNAVAQHLLANLIDYGANYKLTYRPVVADVEDATLNKTLDTVGLQYSRVTDPLAAIAAPGKIALISATPANLKTLADNLPRVQTFTQSGGWLVFHGLTPEGLADYNKIVGFDHMIRPFKRERVTFPASKNPLTSGLSIGDVVMLSGQKMFGFNDDEYTASDEFSYIVDYDDVAPFAKSTFFALDNITNGFVSADGWPLIINYPAPADGKTSDIPLTFPKPQTISEFTWIGNTFYWPQTQVNLVFDGKDKLEFKTKPDNTPQTFAVMPPRTGSEITLQIADWIKTNAAANIGIDNIYLKAQRPADFYAKVKPMLNIGGLMSYPRGAGGIALCNILFKESESVPINAAKKRTMLSTILRNLKAPFSGGKSVIAGAGLKYTPIDLSKSANQYRNEQGWFGEKETTFAALPTGKQTFAGVTYDIYDFKTSPVPTAVMLGGSGIPGNLPDAVRGIPVNRKADALFFLQAARIDNRRNEQERRENKKFEMARYVVHYEDGQTITVPVYAEIDVENYRQAAPTAVRGAQIAWTKAYDAGQSAVAYAKQWDNPRPNVAISSIDFEYGSDRRGVPALLAISAANAQ